MPRGRGGRRRRGDDNGFAEWGGYMNAKKAKLQDQFSKDVDKEEGVERQGIFRGVAIFVNGYTSPTADELKRIMMMNGGIFHHYESPKTTHIIASNLPDTKVKALRGNEKICTPNWITESLKAGKLLDYSNYLLFTNATRTQPKLNFKAKDAKDENFLGEFYNNSRLHHISTMGANFKDYVNMLRSNHKGDFSEARKRLKTSSGEYSLSDSKVIMHIDMDCFFVSVGLRKYPHLQGLPVAVTHSKGGTSVKAQNHQSLQAEMAEYEKRLLSKTGQDASEVVKSKVANLSELAGVSMSEIASCSYEARACGVRNGMFMGTALKLCPHLKTIPYDFESYQEVANVLYDTVAQYTLDIQAVSCDEMLVDVSEVIQDCRISPEDFAAQLRAEIKSKTLCNASVGFGSSILLARLATKKAKPDGVFFLKDSDISDVIRDVRVADLPGVGRTNQYKFKALGIETCEELQSVPIAKLKQEFGAKLGLALFNNCRGMDDRVIKLSQERKSVSVEVNYGIRFTNSEEMERFLSQLCDEVALRMARLGDVKGRHVTLKIMARSENAPEETAKFLGHGLCDSASKSSTLSHPTNDSNVIKREVLLLMKILKVEPQHLRGIGIQVSKLEKSSSKGNQSILGFLATKNAMPSASKDVPNTKEIQEPICVSRDFHFGAGIEMEQLLGQMCEEVAQRMVDLGDVKCHEVKLKLGFRHDVEATDKCLDMPNLVIKSSTLMQATDDCSVLKQEVVLLMTALQTDPREIIHIEVEASKLLSNSFSPARTSKPTPYSMGEIDENVLQELPEEIRKEIEQEMRATKIEFNSKSAKADDVSFSQLDQSVLAQLPDNIVAELKQEYQSRSRSVVSSASEILKEKCKGSPETRGVKKRGRPPKNSTRYIKKSKPVLATTPVKKVLDFNDEPETTDQIKKGAIVEEATLNGVSDLEGVRTMLKKWTDSDEKPSDDDVESVTEFFNKSIRNGRLELAYSTLKSFSRYCQMTNEKSWPSAFNQILREVQHCYQTITNGKRLFISYIH